MRILTWNVNVLRTCLDYHPFSSMKKRNVEGLLDELHAEIFCFQEHKTRRPQLEKSMACPGPYDGFWTFPRSKTGYSGVCTYVDSRYCVPLRAEEGITGLLLDDKASTMRPGWAPEERVGVYPDVDEMDWMDEEGRAFDVKRLDMEGRAVVCDFGLFVLFNLYSPNETNDSRRPYKMNFLKGLQARVRLLQAAGRECIIAGDLNIMRAPIDSGEGGIRTSAEQHYEHPARRILDDWCAPKGPMVDVVRESWPDRDDMFTCWNQKLDARPANYGSRIDLILCTPGLRPWIKGGDILSKVYGSDHCPVFIDLHESIEHPDLGTLHLRDMLNPQDRPPTTAVVYPTDPPREAPEPPRFATKFFEEFSGKQKTLKSFFGGAPRRKLVELSPTPAPGEEPAVDAEPAVERSAAVSELMMPARTPVEEISTPFGLARAAFDALNAQIPVTAAATSPIGVQIPPVAALPEASGSRRRRHSGSIDMTLDEDEPDGRPAPVNGRRVSGTPSENKGRPKTKPIKASQPTLASFFAPPPKQKSPTKSPPPPAYHRPESSQPTPPSPSFSTPRQAQHLPQASPTSIVSQPSQQSNFATEEEDLLIAHAIAEAEADQAEKRAAKNAKAAPIWSTLFAKKLPPLCTVHQKPCKDYIVKIPGPNKGKRFWLCSLPVGAGYDSGRSKRRREDVNPEYRCDFFLWDSANSRKEKPGLTAKPGVQVGS